MADVPERKPTQNSFESIGAAATAILVLALLLGGIWYLFSAPSAPPAISKQPDSSPDGQVETATPNPAPAAPAPETPAPTPAAVQPTVAKVEAPTQLDFTDYEKLPPDRGVVLNLDREWTQFYWPGFAFPQGHNNDQKFVDGKMIFTSKDPHTMMLWRIDLSMPISLQKFPIVKARYRCDAPMDTIAWYHMWMDDGFGPGGGGISPFTLTDVIADGKEHEMHFDLRKNLKGDQCNRMHFSLAPADKPVRYELIALWLEVPPDVKTEPLADDAPITVRVLGANGKPLAGATVTSDRERLNFSRSIVTDADGKGTLIPISNELGQHRVDASAPGLVGAGKLIIRKANSKSDDVVDFRLRKPARTADDSATTQP